nr:reverse transcriptase domain-containing protein [Tanacetum cinerariifolium]
MRTRSNFYPSNSTATIPRHSNRRHVPNIVEPEIRTIKEIVLMADRTMEELLQAPTKGDVPNDAIKLMLFSYSLEGDARIWGNNFQNNQGYRAQMNNVPNFQNQGFQNQPFSVPNNQIQPSVPNEFSNYIKSNEIMIKSMQNQINVLRGDFNKQEENLRKNLNNDMRSILGSFFQNQPSTLGTLSSNTVHNPKDEQNTKDILDKEHSNSSKSTAQVQPPVVPISISKPDVLRTQSKPTIPYPSRLNDQKLQEKSTYQMEKFFQIFHDLHFDISFADALLLMPKFASTIKRVEVCHALADLGASINLMPLSIWKKLSLPELTPTRMTLELADRSITRPKGVAEDIFVKVGKFHFPTNFVVVDFEADPRVPLILGRSITHPKGVAEDIFVKVGKFHFPTNFVVVDFKADPRVPLILGRSFLRTSRALIDVYGEEITLRDDYKPAVQSQRRVNPKIHDVIKKEVIKLFDVGLVTGWRVCIDYRKLNDVTRKDNFPLPFMDQMLERAKVDVIAKLPHPTTVNGVRSFLGHASFNHRFIQDFSKIARPMTHLLEKKTPFVFSKECIDAFNTLKKKLTEASILIIRRCVHGQEAFKILKACHEGPTGGHYGANLTVKKIIRRCVHGQEAFKILKACHEGPTGGHYGANLTVKKRQGKISQKDEMPQNNIQVCEIFDIWGIDFMGPFPSSKGNKYILAYENSVIYKERTKKLHDSKIKNRIFNVGDEVLLFNSRLKIFSRKLKTHWSGPFTITRVFPYGTIELSQPNGSNFKVNGHRVKHYYGGDIPSNVAPNLHTFPMDN